MSVDNEKFIGNDGSEFTNKGLGPRSVSQYDVLLPGKAAHDALIEASQKLIPLADYVENHFSPESPTKSKAHKEQSQGLDGGQSLIQSGEFLIQAINAFACNVSTLAQNLDEKLTILNMDIHKMNHELELANSQLKINRQREALNEIKTITMKKDPKIMKTPGPIVKVGDFTIPNKYKRKRIDFNMFDHIGHGHKIHEASFGNNSVEHSGFINGNDKDSDTTSITSVSSIVTRRRGSSAQRRPSLAKTALTKTDSFKMTLDKSSSSLLKFRAASRTVMAFPTKPTSVGASFPVVPDSPSFIPPTGTSHPLHTSRQTYLHLVELLTYNRGRTVWILSLLLRIRHRQIYHPLMKRLS